MEGGVNNVVLVFGLYDWMVIDVIYEDRLF